MYIKYYFFLINPWDFCGNYEKNKILSLIILIKLKMESVIVEKDVNIIVYDWIVRNDCDGDVDVNINFEAFHQDKSL